MIDNQFVTGGGKNITPKKKLYNSPELQVFNIKTCNIICTSGDPDEGNGGGNIPNNGNIWD